MDIGHICLATPDSDAGERFAALVEAISRRGVEQHVLVANLALARRLADCERVTVGPVVKSPVMAYCLMPNVDITHVHESKSGQAGLLLTLTRSIPFVLSSNGMAADEKNPLVRSVFQRAAQVVRHDDISPGAQAATDVLGIYENVLSDWRQTA